MAERRMMAKSVIETDMFMDMPMSTQCLYFHLLLRADDDGFIRNPSAIRRETGCSQDDFKLLVAKQYIIPFESGVIVIRHWKIHNYIRKDRYNETDCPEKDELELDASNAYKIKASSGSDTNGTPMVYQTDTDCQPNDNHVVDEMDTQVRLGKVRLVTTTTTAREDDDWKKVAESFSKNVHPISGAIERDRLIDLMDSFSSDWLLAAIDEAVVSSNGGISIKYLASILERWKREGFRSERKKKASCILLNVGGS